MEECSSAHPKRATRLTGGVLSSSGYSSSIILLPSSLHPYINNNYPKSQERRIQLLILGLTLD